MRIADFKKMGKKSYLVAIFVAMIIMVLNSAVIFVDYEDMTEGYLTIVLLINIIVTSILANATYYTSRVRIDDNYLSISYYLFFLIANYALAIFILQMDSVSSSILISLFIGIGRLLFVFGILAMKLRFNLEWFYKSIPRMALTSLVVVLLQLFIVLMLDRVVLNMDTFIFVMNGLTVLMLVIINYELVLEEKRENSFAFIFAFTLMLLSLLLTTLTSNTFEMLIQSHILQIFGLGYFFYHVNRNNIIVPEKEKNRLQRQFNLYAMNLKKIIDKKTHQVREANQKFIDELEYAKKIQQSLLPASVMSYRDVKLVSGYFPCERLSGDFFDHYRLDEDNIALYLLDVSGHGISAALLTMFSNNYLKSNDKNQQLFRGLKPDRTLTYFYDQFNQINFPDEMHMVAFYATLNLSTKIMTYCSAGLNCSPIRFKRNGKIEHLDKSQGFPICKLSEFITPDYKSERIKLEKGDRLLFYTDGLVDQDKNNTFDLDSLIRFINSHKNYSIEELNRLIVSTINPLRQTLNDDITYVLLEI